jgi:hypothetical protein
VNINGVELTVLERTGIYDYSWNVFAVMRGDDGLLYVGDTSGCSCYGFEDTLDEVEVVKSWQDAATKAQEWAKTSAYDEEEKAAGIELAERLMTLRPPAFDPSAVVIRA